MANIRSLNIVLVGRTGHGKSATGNTILGNALFNVGNSPNSLTQMIYEGETNYNDLDVWVYDTPGNFECTTNCSSDYEDIKITIENMNMLMRCTSARGGVSAFFLVHSFLGRFTPQEFEAIERIENIFGDTVFSRHGVLVFTHGETVTEDVQTWCSRQSERLNLLFQKFNQRIILISNTSTDVDTIQQSRLQMFRMAYDLQANGTNLYCQINYYEADGSRKLLLFYARLDNIKKDFANAIKQLRQEVDDKNSISKVEEAIFIEKIKSIRKDIFAKRCGTKELDIYDDQLEQVETEIARKKSCSIL